MDPDRYLDRIGLDAAAVDAADRETLERLQRAHVTSVPFETLSITGDPFGPRDGEDVSLDPARLYEKIVERRRGGFCYELNGLFGRLLRHLGFDPDRVAARVVNDGTARPPANHLTHVVEFDRRYVVDVGMGTPTMRRATPLDGTVRKDAAGVEWRVVESDRPDAAYVSQYRTPGEDGEADGDDESDQSDGADGWSDRYVFSDVPRDRSYFAATCDFLATAPESPFTGDPVVTIATERGHKRLSTETLTVYADGGKRERSVDPEEWHDVLETEFGLRTPPPSSDRPDATRRARVTRLPDVL
ncbi:arylamine N-acetyltransferase [Halostella sp. JP-L12]|uniref:arylamine N-acetyltransferase family protein n=1 Tax=Halostella TaxID=1843185 RepID=UPI000EF79915|nr:MULTISPECIES: arylamine N-acetyltransferase [Halostella]NHN47946.1 arylamine N-acetyltransferase [Halostella sp. JP-L12]